VKKFEVKVTGLEYTTEIFSDTGHNAYEAVKTRINNSQCLSIGRCTAYSIKELESIVNTSYWNYCPMCGQKISSKCNHIS
jgi:hypothetical protein